MPNLIKEAVPYINNINSFMRTQLFLQIKIIDISLGIRYINGSHIIDLHYTILPHLKAFIIYWKIIPCVQMRKSIKYGLVYVYIVSVTKMSFVIESISNCCRYIKQCNSLIEDFN